MVGAMRTLLTLALLAFTPSLAAAQHYVDSTGGSDTGAGTAQDPFRTIGRAVQELATTPAPIRLYPGPYILRTGEIFPIEVPSTVAIFDLAPVEPGTVVVRSPESQFVSAFVLHCRKAILSDLHVVSGLKNAIVFQKDVGSASNLTLDRVATTGVGISLLVGGNSNKVTVRDCSFRTNGAASVRILSSAGGHTVQMERTRLRNAITGIQLEGAGNGTLLDLDRVSVSNCAFGVQNTGGGVQITARSSNFVLNKVPGSIPPAGGGMLDASGTAILFAYDCIFWDNAPERDLVGFAPSAFTLTGCIAEQSSLTASPVVYSFDPRLADPEDGDFHLLGTSPAIDSGFFPPVSPLDLDGDPVAIACGTGLPEIGADSFVPDYVYSKEPLRVGTAASLRLIGEPGDVLGFWAVSLPYDTNGDSAPGPPPAACGLPAFPAPVVLGSSTSSPEGFAELMLSVPPSKSLVGVEVWFAGAFVTPSTIRVSTNVAAETIGY